MKAKRNVKGRAVRLSPDATEIIASYSAITGKRESFIASFMVKNFDGVVTGKVKPETVKVWFEALCRVQTTLKLNNAKLRAALAAVPKIGAVKETRK